MTEIIDHYKMQVAIENYDIETDNVKKLPNLHRYEISARGEEDISHLIIYSSAEGVIKYAYVRVALALNPRDSRTKVTKAYPSADAVKGLIDEIFYDRL